MEPFKFSSNTIIARSQAIETAQALIAKESLFLEIESTSFTEKAEIYDICILDSGANVLFQSLVRPSRLYFGYEQKARIDLAELEAAPTWAEIYPEVIDLLTGKRVIVYNAEHIKKCLVNSSLKAGFAWPKEMAFECAMTIYAAYYGKWNGKFREYQYQPLPFSKHDAIGDALAVHRLINHIASTPLPKTIPAAEHQPFAPIKVEKPKEVLKHHTREQELRLEAVAIIFWIALTVIVIGYFLSHLR